MVARCISDYTLLAFSCYMPHRKYKELVHTVPQDPTPSAYGFMLTTLVKELTHHQTMLGINDKIDFIFDNEFMEQEAVRRDWALFKKSNPEIEHLLGDEPQFKDDLYWKPLQAADLLAWLVRNKLRCEAGLPDFVDQPELSIHKQVPMISFGWDEKGLQELRFKMQNLQPVLVGTWGQWVFASFFDPEDGHFFTEVTSDEISKQWFQKQKKRKDRKDRRSMKNASRGEMTRS